MKEGKTKTIAFLIPNIENQIYPSLAIAVETEARRHGYFVVFCNTQEDQEREREYVRNLQNRFVDGFLFSTALGRRGKPNHPGAAAGGLSHGVPDAGDL